MTMIGNAIFHILEATRDFLMQWLFRVCSLSRLSLLFLHLCLLFIVLTKTTHSYISRLEESFVTLIGQVILGYKSSYH